MVEKILALGDKIEMYEMNTSLHDDKKENFPVYVSQLLEFDEDEEDILYIAMPIYEGKLIPLSVGKKYELFFYAKKGIYSCNSEVINRYKSRNVYVLVVRLMTDLKKYQRRQFFRLQTSLAVMYKLFNAEDEKYFRLMGKIPDEMLERPYETGVSLDISGGGIRFISKDRLTPGIKIMVLIDLEIDGEIQKCEPLAKVISSSTAKGRAGQYENRIEFVQIKDPERELLIKYIFREERKLRKRQLE